MKRLLIFALLFVITLPVTAQNNTCPALAAAAFESIRQNCTDVGRDQVCFGHAAVNLEASGNIAFNTPGAMQDLSAVQAISLNPMNIETGEWGAAALKIRANIPLDVFQNVTIIALGDVELRDRGISALPALEMVTNQGVNIRLLPAGEELLIGSLKFEVPVMVTGTYTNDAGEDWYRIRYDGHREGVGWVIGYGLDAQGQDIAILDRVVDPEQAFNPMQAFSLRTGMSDRLCNEVPDSGLLLQSPPGLGEINLQVNGVGIIPSGATLFLQATPGGTMNVYALAGNARVEAYDVSQYFPAGARVQIPLGSDGLASGPPVRPEPYSRLIVAALPTNLMPLPFEIAAPLDATAVAGLASVESIWNVSFTVIAQTNPDESCLQPGNTGSFFAQMTMNPDNTLTLLPLSGLPEAWDATVGGFGWPLSLEEPDEGEATPEAADPVYSADYTYERTRTTTAADGTETSETFSFTGTDTLTFTSDNAFTWNKTEPTGLVCAGVEIESTATRH